MSDVYRGDWMQTFTGRKFYPLAPSDPTNLVLLCGSGTTGCHGWAHHERTLAAWEGFIVASFDDPALIPVRIITYGWVLLTPDGMYELTDGPEGDRE